MRNKSTDSNFDETESDAKQNWLLYGGIKSLLRCDEAETVRGIARYVISQYSSLRIGSAFVERRRNTPIPLVAAFLGATTRFLEVREPERRDGIVWVARLENERRAIEKLPPLLSEFVWTELVFRRPPDRAAVAALPRKLFPLRRRIFKLVRLLFGQKHEFFKILRVAEMLGYYARYLDIFQKGNFQLAVMSSHSNPHGIAFNLAARRCGIPTVLITHGMPVRPVARLAYDLAVLHCEAARQIYIAEGCRIKRSILHGRRQDYRPMPEQFKTENLTIGIFLCKDVNEKRLREVIEELSSDPKVSRIIVRPHPKNLFVHLDEWLASLASVSVRRSFNQTVAQDLTESDVVFGGNSSVLIEAVTAGRAACYVNNLDYGSPDLHELVARGLVCSSGTKLDFDFGEIFRFYRRDGWIEILRVFADIDIAQTTVDRQIADAVHQIIAR